MESRNPDGSPQRLPVPVLTGVPGIAGAPVLDHPIWQPVPSRTLVFINDFGVGHDLVTHGRDDVVIEMSGDCLRCTTRGDPARFEVRV